MKQLTLSIIKPDAMSAGYAGRIISRLQTEGFSIAGLKQILMTKVQAEGFYAEHAEKPFFGSLVSFMTEGPVIVLALEREDAVAGLREIMGVTNPAEAAEGTIRRALGTSIERNAIHGSANPDDAARELSFFFAEYELI